MRLLSTRSLRRGLAAAVIAALAALPAAAALAPGANAPGFTAEASLDGKAFPFSLEAALKKGPVVVYFYPSAYTGGAMPRPTPSPRRPTISPRRTVIETSWKPGPERFSTSSNGSPGAIFSL